MYAPIPMVPGPVTLHPDVLAALARDYGSGQIEAGFLPLYRATSRNLARLLGTKNDVVLMTGEGMLALWGALKSALKPGDAVVSVCTGVFGDGIGDMAASIGCRVEKISLPFNHTLDDADLGRIEETLRRVQPVMLTAVHCETPSGTLNPLARLGRLKADLAVPLFYVDAVASVGGMPVEADGWHIDLVLGGSQKCLSAPPSMAFLGVSEAAWERMAKVNYQGYDAVLPFRAIYKDGRCPYTPYWHGVAALHAASSAILREGSGEVFARHEQVAAQCRAGLARLGIELWTEPHAVNAPSVTAALVPQDRDWPTWQKTLSDRGLVVAGSFGPMAGKVFRLGHMGAQAQAHLMDMALEAIEDALRPTPSVRA
jgi:aspartate aminotransferase-like enzyme